MKRLLAVFTVVGLTIGLVLALPVQAAFPGKNGRIVFDTAFVFFEGAGSSQIYSVHPNGDGLRQLTNVPDGTSAWQPRVSADGLSVVFIRSTEGENDQLWLMDIDGTHERALTNEPNWSHGGAGFTPDGSRVVYSRCGAWVPPYFTCRIVSVRLDGTGRQTIIGGTWHPSEAVVSPDGSTIAYVSDKGGFDARLWLADADGTHARTIGPTFGVERLSWAPDGSHLAFTGDFRNGKVFTIAADGSDLTRVARRSIFPAWSPNGQWISHLKESTGDLERRHPDGSHVLTVVSSEDVPGIGFSDWSVTS